MPKNPKILRTVEAATASNYTLTGGSIADFDTIAFYVIASTGHVLGGTVIYNEYITSNNNTVRSTLSASIFIDFRLHPTNNSIVIVTPSADYISSGFGFQIVGLS